MTETSTVNGQAITLPAMDTAIPPVGATTIVLNGERLDNVAKVFYGDMTQYPRVAKRNNIGFIYDTAPDKRILVE